MSIAHYLSRYAESETQLAPAIGGMAAKVGAPWQHVLAVPLCNESAACWQGWLTALQALPNALCIAVVNNREDHSDEVKANNQQLLTEWRAQLSELRSVDALAAPMASAAVAPAATLAQAWLGRRDGVAMLLLDRASVGRTLPRRQGVGLARKIGADLALALTQRQALSARWIHMSDGDVELPADYFVAAQAPAVASASALYYRYRHRGGTSRRRHDHTAGRREAAAALSEDSARAHAIYELYLRYYRAALAQAGSAYAYYAIGSTLAVAVEAYAAVRGSPRRQAGEDFYLLNKLAKVGPVLQPHSDPLQIHARHSLRVPFGTGRATASIAAEGHFSVEAPLAFRLLGVWLTVLQALAAAESPSVAAALRQAQVLAKAAEGDAAGEALAQALAELDMAAAERLLRGTPPAQRERRLNEWFDGFRTMKLLHAMRDAGIAEVPWWQALREGPLPPLGSWCGATTELDQLSAADLFTACERLAALLGE